MYMNTILIASLAGLIQLASATSCINETICVDGINDCGEPWGGCYNPCSEPAPVPKPCPTTPIDNCSTRTVCIDNINSCGIWYGTCIPDCKPWPTIPVPPCPTTTTFATVTSGAGCAATPTS